MKLLRSSTFVHEGLRYRVCHLAPEQGRLFAIDVAATTLRFRQFTYAELKSTEREPNTAAPKMVAPKSNWLAKAEVNHAHIKPFLDMGANLFEPDLLQAQLDHLCRGDTGRCQRTILNLLRRYFQRGMSLHALLPDYANCGTTAPRGCTSGRGKKGAYQLTAVDTPKLQAAVDYLLNDERRTMTDAHQWMGGELYVYIDGNGDKCLLPASERPSIHQFRRYVKKAVPLETFLKKRHGEKYFIREHKPTLGDTIRDCLGIADVYEIDATVGDVLIVSSADRQTVIGKATVYLIVDRRSRLIVGFYVGLEHPCWETAVEAICSLLEPKDEICARYGVQYDPADWPADGLLPQSFLGDNAEMKSHFSDAIASQLCVEVANPSSHLPNHKPNVETRFKLTTRILRAYTPGYVPPEDFGKRCRKRYEKEACLTLDEFVAELLQAIIKYNRSPITQSDVRYPDQILREVEPSPIALWHDGIAHHGGSMAHEARLDEVRLALLPRGTASITDGGIVFDKLTYAPTDPLLRAACGRAAHKERRSEIAVTFDRRCVDLIYAHLPNREVVPVLLSAKSREYAGMSFYEVRTINKKASEQKPSHKERREQEAFKAHSASKKRIRVAEEKRDELGPTSINARTKDSKQARTAERHQHNRETAASYASPQSTGNDQRANAPPASANVVGLPVRNRMTNRDPSNLSPAQRARQGF